MFTHQSEPKIDKTANVSLLLDQWIDNNIIKEEHRRRGGGGGRGRARGQIVSDEICAAVDVLAHGMLMRETGQSVQLNLSRFTGAFNLDLQRGK